MSKNVKKIGIVDQPNVDFSSDTLKIKPHADALTNFIEQCDTPITIGIQGEWGSGKTSLLNLIENNLNGLNSDHKYNQGKFLQIWVNAWEHSLLSKPEETLLKIVNQIINDLVAKLDKGDNAKEQIKQKFAVLAKGALRVATSAVAGDEATKVVSELIGDDSNVISELKKQLDSLARTINRADRGSIAEYEKIVIYVDDLDRIDPPDAVAILELLKNIFNVKHCIFVLAIDYQVVVKGLKHKFGDRKDENEWEFRAFFDKIIQLPFMMPVGQYKIGNYVEHLLEQIDFLKEDQEIEDGMDVPVTVMIQEIVKLSIGGNPRSLKRLVNSLSLIQIFADLKLKSSEEEVSDSAILNETEKDMLMFSIMCMQIKYPEIYDVLKKYPDFRQWNDKVALEVTDRKEESNSFPNFEKDFETACGISWEEYKNHYRPNEIGKLAKINDQARKEFDEYWEQILFIICYPNPRYRRRADDISNLLSYIDKQVLKDKPFEDTAKSIRYIVNQTSVTSVTTTDDLKSDIETKPYQRKDLDSFGEYITIAKEELTPAAKKIAYSESMVPLLNDIELKLKDLFKDNKLVRFRFTPTGGLTLYVRQNTKQEWGRKFGAVTFGRTEPSVAKKLSLEPKFFVNIELSKMGPRYRKSEIISLFPSQNRHTSHMYSLEIRNMNDFNILIENEFFTKTSNHIMKEGFSSHRKEGQPSNMKYILVEAKIKDYKQNLDEGASSDY